MNPHAIIYDILENHNVAQDTTLITHHGPALPSSAPSLTHILLEPIKEHEIKE